MTAYKKCGIKCVGTHTLRRTHATLTKIQGVDTEVIRDALGHTNSAMTEKRYIDFTKIPRKNTSKYVTDLLISH